MPILVTGFDPFGGADDNPSARVIELLARDAKLAGHVAAAVLPVSLRRMPGMLAGLMETVRPAVVLGLGEARGCACVRVEHVAVNRLDFTAPDNDDTSIVGGMVVPGGPAEYRTTLDADAIIHAVRAAGVACEASQSAGTYLCNQMMYLALHLASQSTDRPPAIAGFIHLPSLPTQNTSRRPGCPTMDLETQLKAVRTAIHFILGGRRQ